MSRILAKHSIEAFVKVYLSKFVKTNNLRKERRFIEKAIKQIEFFLNPPCCLDPDASITYSRLDNDLTRYINAQFTVESFDRRKWRKSLERAKLALYNSINNPCCLVTIDIQWSNTLPANHRLLFVDELGNEFRTSIIGAGPQTLTLADNAYKVCVEVLVDLGEGTFELTKDGDLVVGGGDETATYCPILFEDLGQLYVVTFT